MYLPMIKTKTLPFVHVALTRSAFGKCKKLFTVEDQRRDSEAIVLTRDKSRPCFAWQEAFPVLFQCPRALENIDREAGIFGNDGSSHNHVKKGALKN